MFDIDGFGVSEALKLIDGIAMDLVLSGAGELESETRSHIKSAITLAFEYETGNTNAAEKFRTCLHEAMVERGKGPDHLAQALKMISDGLLDYRKVREQGLAGKFAEMEEDLISTRRTLDSLEERMKRMKKRIEEAEKP